MSVLLPYQQKFLNSEAKVRVWRKSRRIGATYAVAYGSCLTAGRATNPWSVWLSSADMFAGKEFIRDAAHWAKKLNQAVKELGETVLEDEYRDITAMSIELATKKRITALSSNPRSFRSKGGAVILDELAFHEQPRELWKAATPVTRWGGDICALSSVGVENNFFEELCDKAKTNKKGTFYFQQTTIIDAIDDGLVSKILKKEASLKDKDQFLLEIREECLSEEDFLQEYMCIPSSNDSEYWLPWDLITNVESQSVKLDGSNYKGGKTVIGHDIAIRGDKTVYVVFEHVGDVLYLIELRILSNEGRKKGEQVTFAEQARVMDELEKKYNPYRIYVDQSGMGEKPTEDYKTKYGSERVQGIIFTPANKQELAINAKQMFEDRNIRLPFACELIRGDLRKIKRSAGTGNIPKFDSTRDKTGHADIAWAIFLALLAGKTKYQPYKYEAVQQSRFADQRIF